MYLHILSHLFIDYLKIFSALLLVGYVFISLNEIHI